MHFSAPWSSAEPPGTRLPGVRKQLLRAAQGRVPGPGLRLSALHGGAAQVAPCACVQGLCARMQGHCARMQGLERGRGTSARRGTHARHAAFTIQETTVKMMRRAPASCSFSS